MRLLAFFPLHPVGAIGAASGTVDSVMIPADLRFAPLRTPLGIAWLTAWLAVGSLGGFVWRALLFRRHRLAARRLGQGAP